MIVSRRTFLGRGAAGCGLLATGTVIPGFLARTVQAALQSDSDDRILVVLQLTGGNDGLNTIIPYRDDLYYKTRPVIAVPRGQAIALDDAVGLHPQLGGWKELYDEGWMSVIHGVGYPNPNRSHFESMDIWHTCCSGAERRDATGWVGRWAEEAGADAGASVHAPAAYVGGGAQPLALASARQTLPSIVSLDDLRVDFGPIGPGGKQRLGRLHGGGTAGTMGAGGTNAASGNPDDLLFIRKTMLMTLDEAEMLGSADRARSPGAGYPPFPLADQLRLVADLIAVGMGARVYYTQISGFDTHAKQRQMHDQLMTQLGQSVRAFFNDLKGRGLAQRVLMMSFSEFGRRVEENRSQGTDHGAAAPMFLFGPAVKSGLFGPAPDLSRLDQGDLKHTVDFRGVYAGVLRDWLRADPAKILRGSYEPLTVVAG